MEAKTIRVMKDGVLSLEAKTKKGLTEIYMYLKEIQGYYVYSKREKECTEKEIQEQITFVRQNLQRVLVREYLQSKGWKVYLKNNLGIVKRYIVEDKLSVESIQTEEDYVSGLKW